MARIRIPLSGPYSSRVSAVNAGDPTSGYWGTGVWGSFIWGKSTQATDKDARYINCFRQTVTDTVSGKKRIFTVKRPGFGTQSTPASGKKGYAILVWTGSGAGTSVASAFDNPSTVYIDTTGVGAITGKATGITETVISTTPTLTVTSDDSTAWYYDAGVGVMTKIIDPDFPGNAGKSLAGTMQHLKGFALQLTTDGLLFASDINSLTGWTANSFDSTNSYPDKGVGLLRHGDFIMALGSESIEFWYNAGLTPFPLARASAKTIKIGCISADAIAEISDTKFWAGSTPQGGLSVFQYDGSFSRISTPEIDAVLILAGASNISMTTIRNFGRSFVYVRAGATTLAYCIEEKYWFEVSATTPLWYKVVGLSLGATMVNYAISNVSTSGKVYLQNHASLVFTDDSMAYTARIQTAPDDQGTNKKKFYEYLDIVGDTESSTSNLTISYSDDDYATYTTWGDIDLSSTVRRATRLGASARRGWVFTHSAATPMRLEKAEGEMTVGYS